MLLGLNELMHLMQGPAVPRGSLKDCSLPSVLSLAHLLPDTSGPFSSKIVTLRNLPVLLAGEVLRVFNHWRDLGTVYNHNRCRLPLDRVLEPSVSP